MFYVTSGQPIHLTHLKKRNDSNIYTVELLLSGHPQKLPASRLIGFRPELWKGVLERAISQVAA